MKTARILLALLIASLLGTAVFAQDDENAVKERIKTRVPQVDALKIAGTVGENSKGFLEPRAALAPEQTQLVNVENNDRRALYNFIAEKLRLTVADVGAKRAEQIRNNAAAGVWLQAADGTWYKK